MCVCPWSLFSIRNDQLCDSGLFWSLSHVHLLDLALRRESKANSDIKNRVNVMYLYISVVLAFATFAVSEKNQ